MDIINRIKAALLLEIYVGMYLLFITPYDTNKTKDHIRVNFKEKREYPVAFFINKTIS